MKPDFIFLIETMVKRDKVDSVRSLLGYEGLFVVDSIGHGGGLALLWKGKNMARLLSFSQHHIDVEVHIEGMQIWRLTGYYGHPERNKRREFWNLLHSLSSKTSLPWCCLGGFNDLLKNTKKRGLLDHPNWLIKGFRATTVDSGLRDIGMEGHPFTWERRRGHNDWIKERLDKALANDLWCSLFHNAKLSNVEASTSDHTPIFLTFMQTVRSRNIQKFKFENAWLRERTCRDIVDQSWKSNAEFPTIRRISACGGDLLRWSSKITTTFREKIKQCKRQMEELRPRRDEDSLTRFQEAKMEYNLILSQQEDYWR